jgi:chromosomal replication initiator protein
MYTPQPTPSLPSPAAAWEHFLTDAREQISDHVVETWFRPLRCQKIVDETIVLEVRDHFSRDWLTDHYLDFIRSGLVPYIGSEPEIQWVINPNLKAPEPAEADKEDDDDELSVRRSMTATSNWSGPHFNRRYTFQNFVCGPSNQFAVAACHAVTEKPGQAYNPLFLFGRVGLGKTHLLSAIGHGVLERHPERRVIYTTSEQFTNEVVNAVLNNRLTQLHKKYRDHCGVLLIDDIQLIAGKDRTQHEFFHIFNTLYDSQRQIVVTSDKLPHEIPDIEERLRNRFQFGLLADIQSPEIETRVAILKRKAMDENIELPDDVAFFLAENVRTNVRELEGALVRVMAHASLTGCRMSVEQATNVLTDLLQAHPNNQSVEGVQKTVAHYYSLKVADLKSKRRHKTLVRPRQVAMYLARKHVGASYPDLGSRFGNKDHTTVMSACKRIGALVKTDSALRKEIHELERKMDVLQK